MGFSGGGFGVLGFEGLFFFYLVFGGGEGRRGLKCWFCR